MHKQEAHKNLRWAFSSVSPPPHYFPFLAVSTTFPLFLLPSLLPTHQVNYPDLLLSSTLSSSPHWQSIPRNSLAQLSSGHQHKSPMVTAGPVPSITGRGDGPFQGLFWSSSAPLPHGFAPRLESSSILLGLPSNFHNGDLEQRVSFS